MLTASINTMLAKAAVESVNALVEVYIRFHRGAWVDEAILRLSSPQHFEHYLVALLARAARRYSELRVAPVTVGIAGDTRQFPKVCKALNVTLPEGKLYDRLNALCRGFLKAYSGRLLGLMSRPWSVSVREAVRVSYTSGAGVILPALVRSISMYEAGRFSGFRDEKLGKLTKGVLEVRGNEAWWALALTAPAASLMAVERTPQGEVIMTFVHFDPIYGVEYGPADFRLYGELTGAVEEFIRRTGVFVEDEELFKLTLLLYAYSKVSSPLAYGGAEFGVGIRCVKAVGRRFTESHTLMLRSGEISTVHKALWERFGEEAGDVASACAELGSFIQSIIRRAQAIARELGLDAFAVKLRMLFRSLVEPGYTPPSEHLYSIVRMIRVSDWRARFTGLLANKLQLEEGLGREEAHRNARRMLKRLEEAVATVSA